MKKYNKQRLFEVMERLDESFKPQLNEIKNDISDVVSHDIIKLIFNPQELDSLKVNVDDDIKSFNSYSDNESELYDVFAIYRNDSLEEGIQNIMKSRGIVINEETVKFLAYEIQTYFM